MIGIRVRTFPASGVGCFDPAMILHFMSEAFGPDLEFDAADLLNGHYERTLASAEQLGISPDSPVVLCAARLVRESSPRYKFRLRVGPDSIVTGQVDRYTLLIKEEVPEPARTRFTQFVESLRLGEIDPLM
jgi:hypothetical protein